jgi:8-oxo-dGTP diphosphatase
MGSINKLNQQVDKTRYQIVPRSLIFIRFRDEVLLLKGNADKKIWPNLYNGIGGHIEKGEDIYQAALRELEEETGINGISLDLKCIVMIDPGDDLGIGLFVFTGEVKDRTIKAGPEGELFWLKMEELTSLQLVPDLYELLPRVMDGKRKTHFGKYIQKDGEMLISFTG